MTSRNEKGFTLIEMSIVLVLIGLIIGGILKGQEMINATRLKMTVNQWDGIKAAWNSFEDKYNGLPGDYNRASTLIKSTLGDGDGDIRIEVGQAMVTNNTGSTEMQAAWNHMLEAGLLAGFDKTTATANARLRGKLRGTEWVLAYDSALATDGWVNDNRHHVVMVNSSSATIPAALNAAGVINAVTGRQANDIDRKYDDESGTTGSIRFTGTTPTALSDTIDCRMSFAIGD